MFDVCVCMLVCYQSFGDLLVVIDWFWSIGLIDALLIIIYTNYHRWSWFSSISTFSIHSHWWFLVKRNFFRAKKNLKFLFILWIDDKSLFFNLESLNFLFSVSQFVFLFFFLFLLYHFHTHHTPIHTHNINPLHTFIIITFFFLSHFNL